MAAGGIWVGVASRGFVGVPRTTLVVVGLLGLFLVGWAVGGEAEYQTAFSKEQFATIREQFPGGFILLPWWQRLCLIGSGLLAVPALAWLGRSPVDRRLLLGSVAASGLLAALVSLGQQWLRLPVLPWLMIQGETERWNAGFFHYSGLAACLNLAWPLIVFSKIGNGLSTALEWSVKAGIVVVAGVVLAASGSAAGLAVGAGLLVAGSAWQLLRNKWYGHRGVAVSCMGVAVLGVMAWQGAQIRSVALDNPDGWTSAAETRSSAPQRDVAFRDAVSRRGDRLAVSSAPARAALWMAGARMAADHPLRGPGPGSWSRWSPLYSNEPFVNTFFHALQFTHNDPLQTAAEWGVVPAILWLVLWGGALWRASGKVDQGVPGASGIVLALFGVALHSLVDFPLQMPALQIWAALLLGLAWGRSDEKKAAKASASEAINAGSNRRRAPDRRRRRHTPDPA